jgi:hypothetical protein
VPTPPVSAFKAEVVSNGASLKYTEAKIVVAPTADTGTSSGAPADTPTTVVDTTTGTGDIGTGEAGAGAPPTPPPPPAPGDAAAAALATALGANATATGSTVTVTDNMNVPSNVTVPSGVTLVIPAAKTITLDSYTLEVKGTLSVAGTFTVVHNDATHVRITGSVIAKNTGTINNQRRSDAWFASTGTDGNTNITYEAGSTAKEWRDGGATIIEMIGTDDTIGNVATGGYAIIKWDSTAGGSIIVKPGTPEKRTIDHASVTLRRNTDVGTWHLTDGSQLTLQADSGADGNSPPQGALWFYDTSTLTGAGSAKLILDRGNSSVVFSGYISRRVALGTADKDTAFQNLFKLSGGATAAQAVADPPVCDTTNYQERLTTENTTDAVFTWDGSSWKANLAEINP